MTGIYDEGDRMRRMMRVRPIAPYASEIPLAGPEQL